jgi:hypothetical protein
MPTINLYDNDFSDKNNNAVQYKNYLSGRTSMNLITTAFGIVFSYDIGFPNLNTARCYNLIIQLSTWFTLLFVFGVLFYVIFRANPYSSDSDNSSSSNIDSSRKKTRSFIYFLDGFRCNYCNGQWQQQRSGVV